MIKAIDLSFWYQHNEPIFKGINLEIRNKEKIIIWGKSGSGKSTLLQLLGQLIRPKKGRIEYENLSPFEISWCFQDPLLVDEFSAMENIQINSEYSRQEITHYLRKLGIENLAKIKTSYLSGGEKQRIAIVRALATDKKVLIIDEPTAMVDQVTKQGIYEILEGFEGTLIMATHDPIFRKFEGNHYIVENYSLVGI